MKFHTVPVTGLERIGSYTLISYPWEGPVEPGRFAMARAAGYPVTLDPFLARPFSFYDHDGETARLLFEVRGRGTALLDSPGATIEVTAPLGRGFAPGKAGRKAALVGGGIGVAPLKLLSRRLDEAGVPHDVFLGFARADGAAIAGRFPRSGVATMDGSVGALGTVLDIAPRLHEYPSVYACGPNPMLAAVKFAVGARAFCQLSVEERMGCGNGSCNGCAVPLRGGYVRSCVEGPVFEAEALAW